MDWRNVILSVMDGSFADHWFKWVNWLLITSALHVLGKAGDSSSVLILSYMSAFLMMLSFTHLIDIFNQAVIPEIEKTPEWVGILLRILILVVGMYIISAVYDAINTTISVLP